MASETVEMNSHNITPCQKGFGLMALKELRLMFAPIRKRLRRSPFLASNTMVGEISSTAGMKVLMTEANTKSRMNDGMLSFFFPSLNSRLEINTKGTIQSARVSLRVVAICSASSP